MLNPIQKVILSSIVRSVHITDVLKIMTLSYLFYKLCWDFKYDVVCADIQNGLLDYVVYDFENIQNPRPVGDETDILKEVN